MLLRVCHARLSYGVCGRCRGARSRIAHRRWICKGDGLTRSWLTDESAKSLLCMWAERIWGVVERDGFVQSSARGNVRIGSAYVNMLFSCGRDEGVVVHWWWAYSRCAPRSLRFRDDYGITRRRRWWQIKLLVSFFLRSNNIILSNVRFKVVGDTVNLINDIFTQEYVIFTFCRARDL